MDWRDHERYAQDLLGLDSTPASGAKFYAPGDAVDNHHPSESNFRLLADCKTTEKLSFSLNRAFLHREVERATELGKRFIMPVRFWHHGDSRPEDYVVVEMHDFAELLELARNNQPGTRDPDNPQGVRDGMASSGDGISGVDRLRQAGGGVGQ